MKVVFYNTASTAEFLTLDFYPNAADEWDKLAALYSDHEFVIVTKLPGVPFVDAKGGKVLRRSEKVKYVLIEENDSVDEIAQVIYDLAPAVAVSISTPAFPLDWNPIKDSLIAEKLEQMGVKTIAHKTFTSVACFDKWRTHLVLRELGFAVAKAVYVHNGLLDVEKEHPEICLNVYREYVLHRIKEMTFPVIIKATAGAASMGLTVEENFEQTKNLIMSSENDGDVIVEEFVQGEQFGTEIHGVKGKYHVLPPFHFSTNEAGITDPFYNVKYGPVRAKRYNIPQLQESLRRMAETLNFAGSAQVDLIFSNGKWYVVEINPRWSGMTPSCAYAQGRMPYAIYAESALGSKVDYSKQENLKYVLGIKIPALSDTELERMYQFPNVFCVSRGVSCIPGVDMQYCEAVYGGFDTKEELLSGIKSLRDAFPDIVSPRIIENAEKLAAADTD